MRAPESQIRPPVTAVLALVTIASFLTWVWSAFERASRLGARPPRSAVSVMLSFFVPILNFFWPYLGLRQFDDAIEPERLPEPPPRPASDAGPHGYREAAREKGRERIRAPRPPLAWWWGIWVFLLLGWIYWGFDESPPTVIGLELLTDVDAILAAVVILRIEARLMERARRLA
jgi:hypothetical protein